MSTGRWYRVTCIAPLWGTDVRVTNNNNNWMNLWEMKVFGQKFDHNLGYINVDETQFTGHANFNARVKITGDWTSNYKDITITDRCSR